MTLRPKKLGEILEKVKGRLERWSVFVLNAGKLYGIAEVSFNEG